MRAVATFVLTLALATPIAALPAPAEAADPDGAIHALTGLHRHRHHHRRHLVRIPRIVRHARRFAIQLPRGTSGPGPSRDFITARPGRPHDAW